MSNDSHNEQYIVTARKWRPMTFAEVVGQDHIATTLRNAMLTGRVHHAYLFTGPRGVGKTTSARIVAKALNCLNPGADAEPCNECASCKDIMDGRSIDVIEIDGASNNSVEDIRKLRENSRYPPVHGKYKLYIIDEVHMLSTSAFNALLKTLEEPPPHLMFIFATTEVHKVPATILSRCQRFDFRRMEIDTIVSQLSKIAQGEGISIDEESLIAIARKADGSMRDSQSIFDQVRAFCGNVIVAQDVHSALHLIDTDFFFRISNAIKTKNVGEMFAIAKEVLSKGYDIQECLNGLLEHFRNILTVKATGNTKLIETSATYHNKYEVEAAFFTQTDLLRLMSIITQAEHGLRYAAQPRVRFELALTQMASLDSTIEITALLQEIRSGEISSAPMPSIEKKNPEINKPTPAPKIVEKAEQNISAIQELPSTTSHQIIEEWNAFIDSCSTALQFLLHSTEASMKGDVLLLTTAQDFTAEQLRLRNDELLVAIEAFCKTTMQVEITSGKVQAQAMYESSYFDVNPTKKDSQSGGLEFIASAPSNLETIEKNKPKVQEKELNPIEKTIVDLFNGREVR